MLFPGIFVSYRRDDSAGHAGRLFDHLENHFGKDRIFMDIDIEPGEDYVTVIENALGSCEILIAIIGRYWLFEGSEATRRLDDPNDFVRLEIATALSRNINVFPVLVQRASMPRSQDLPQELAPFARRNAIELSDSRWRHDVDQLIRVLEKTLNDRAESRRRAAQEEKERQHREAERLLEESRLAETARQAEVERQRKDAEEKLRAEEEERKRRAAAEVERREAGEVLRQREDEERVRAEAEARRLADQETEHRRAEAVRQEESHRLEEEEQARTEGERLRRVATEADHQRVASAQDLQVTSEQKPAGQTDPSSPTRQPLSQAIEPSSGKRRRTTLFVILVCLSLLSVIALVWKRPWTSGAPGSATPAATPTTPLPTPSPPPTATIPQAPAGMVFVPGGEFTMGRDGDPTGYESPAHQVTVNPFYIDLYEVTREAYQKCVDEKKCQPPSIWNGNKFPDGTAKLPVTGVTWNDANVYAKWAGKRLPTEEEWEFAARGGKKEFRYPWGNEWKHGLANANSPSNGLAEVGSYKGTWTFGVFDMVGNAWEWTASKLKPYKKGQTLPNRPAGDLRVIRGGSYLEDEYEATTTYRRGYPVSGVHYEKTGFRCAKDIAFDK